MKRQSDIKIIGTWDTRNNTEKWIYDPSGISPTLMAGSEPNKKTNTHLGTRRIFIVTKSVLNRSSGLCHME